MSRRSADNRCNQHSYSKRSHSLLSYISANASWRLVVINDECSSGSLTDVAITFILYCYVSYSTNRIVKAPRLWFILRRHKEA